MRKWYDKLGVPIRAAVISGAFVILVAILGGIFELVKPAQRIIISFPSTETSLLTPSATSALPFPTAGATESLIVVADFADHSNGAKAGIYPGQYIFEELQARVASDNLDLRVERLPVAVDEASARSKLGASHATLILWGWYDDISITPRITRAPNLIGQYSGQEGLRISLADPQEISFDVLTDLPTQANYLVLFTLGMDRFTRLDPTSATAYFTSAIKAASQTGNTTTNPAEAHFFRGDIAFFQQDFPAAIDDFSSAIDRKPAYVLAYEWRAISNFYAAVEPSPEHDYLRSSEGDYLKVLDLIQNNPDQEAEVNAYIGLGEVYTDTPNYELASTYFEEALALEPDNQRAIIWEAELFDRMGDFSRAKDKLEVALTSHLVAFGDPLTCYLLGRAYYGLGESTKAIENFDTAIKIDNDMTQAYYARGIAYACIGERVEAVKDLQEFISRSPYEDWDALAKQRIDDVNNSRDLCSEALIATRE